MNLLAADPCREAVQHARTFAERVDDAGSDAEVVVDEIELGRAEHREIDPVGVRHPHEAFADRNLDRWLLGRGHPATVPAVAQSAAPRAARSLSVSADRIDRATESFCRNAGAFVCGRANAPDAGRLVNAPSACTRGCTDPPRRTTRRSGPVTTTLPVLRCQPLSSEAVSSTTEPRSSRLRNNTLAVRLTVGVAMRESTSAAASTASE